MNFQRVGGDIYKKKQFYEKNKIRSYKREGGRRERETVIKRRKQIRMVA